MSGHKARPFSRVLIANRGEIACRVVRTTRAMGLRSLAVYSSADAGALHVALADEAFELQGHLASDTYLSIERVLEAARAMDADAVHPGYGFLSENPDFVDACESAGLVFIGPPASAMRAMGLKDAAKRRMAEAGVPIVPGYHGDAQDDARLAAEAERIGYPVLIKARAGGGGKGMRRVDVATGFAEALASARREARASFGDDAVLIERYVDSPRHVEVQVFGDVFGRVVHLFERECSLQRRHQKVIEEAPAPGIDSATRAAMTEAAVIAAQAVGYVGAGTVEFIADGREGLRPDGFWFMEMNTRLQVEHPVTEAVTGIDLVEWQLRVASGQPLPRAQSEIDLNGHAFEARLYAEDTAAGFLPATGRLERLSFGGADAADRSSSFGLRVDSGVREGDVISPYYDPMLAKLVSWGADRSQALNRLDCLLADTVVLGTITNRDFLLSLCRHESVRAGRLDTDFIGRELQAGELLAGERQIRPLQTRTPQTRAPQGLSGATTADDPADRDAREARALLAVIRAAAFPSSAATITRDAGTAAGVRSTASIEPVNDARLPVAARLGCWILWGEPGRRLRFDSERDEPVDVQVVRQGLSRWKVIDGDGALQVDIQPARLRALSARVAVDGRERMAHILFKERGAELQWGERVHRFSWSLPGEQGRKGDVSDDILAPMAGRVIAVEARPGDDVASGQTLITLEAMKMEHALVAPRDAQVAGVTVQVGAQVAQGDELVRFEPVLGKP